jgi:hypothetical protein
MCLARAAAGNEMTATATTSGRKTRAALCLRLATRAISASATGS